MLKKELRSYLGVILRNGEKGVVSGDSITTESLSVYGLSLYREDLKHCFNDEFDIIKVYDTTEFEEDEILWKESEEDHFIEVVEDLQESINRLLFLHEILENTEYADFDPVSYTENWQEYDILTKDIKRKLKL